MSTISHIPAQFFLYDAFQAVRRETGRSIPVYVLQSASVTALLHLCGPEDLGGKGDLAKKLETITEKDEAKAMEEANSVCLCTRVAM